MPDYSSVLQNNLGKFRRGNPNKAWTWNGKTYYGTTAALSDSEVAQLIAEGALNVGDADPRAVSFTPSDFTGNEGPKGTNEITSPWGVLYIASRGYRTDMGGAWRVICYRTPPTGAQVDDTAQEAQW